MPGFLERLAGRTLGTGAVVKPVVPVSFGPSREAPPMQEASIQAAEPLRNVEDAPERLQTARPAQTAINSQKVTEVVERSLVEHSTEASPGAEARTIPVVVERRPARAIPATNPAVAPPIAVPRVEARVESARRTVQPKPLASQPPAGPVVRISIGRIDVRAEFAPAAPVRVASRAPSTTLSLEEYRRQRDGGLR